MPEPPVMPPASAPAPLDLAAIRALLAAIGDIQLKCEESGTYPGSYSLVETGPDWNNDAWVDPDGYFPAAALPTFLAAAPAAVAALLAEVDRLRDLVDYYQAQHLMPGWPGPQP